jgi:ribonuclease I
MTIRDEFGEDPTVQRMRRVFKGMEKVQERLIESSGLSFFDERLRAVRESALRAFEQAWAQGAGHGVSLTENDYAHVYEACFLKILEQKACSK